jgi:RNA polymerase sigma-70 factor (ECF subfamily)
MLCCVQCVGTAGPRSTRPTGTFSSGRPSCIAGDRVAFEQFYRDNRRFVAGNLYRVLGDRNELDDLVQEVFVIAFRGMARFRGEAKLSTWIYRVCVNVALGRLRSRSRRAPPIPYADLVEEPVDETATAPDVRIQQKQELEQAYRALEHLAPKKRIVFVLHEIQGLDIKEIASIVQAPLVTVRTRLHYARKEFYERVAVLEAGEGGD